VSEELCHGHGGGRGVHHGWALVAGCTATASAAAAAALPCAWWLLILVRAGPAAVLALPWRDSFVCMMRSWLTKPDLRSTGLCKHACTDTCFRSSCVRTNFSRAGHAARQAWLSWLHVDA